MKPSCSRHFADAEFHLKNAMRALEAAADTAPNPKLRQHAQGLAAHTRKLRAMSSRAVRPASQAEFLRQSAEAA